MLRLLLIMAITFVGVGSTGGGTSSAAPTVPTGNVGDMLVLCVTGRHDTSGMPAPTATGYNGGNEHFATVQSIGDSEFGYGGYVGAAILTRVADGTEGSTLAVSGTDWTRLACQIFRYRNTVGSWVGQEKTAGVGASLASNSYSVLFSGASDWDPPDTRTGDFILACTGADIESQGVNNQTLVASGDTFANTERGEFDLPPTPPLMFCVSEHSVTSAGGSHNPQTYSFNYSASKDGKGITVMFRLREYPVDASPSVPDTITVGLTELPLVTVAFAVQDTASVGLGDAVAVEEQTATKSVSDTITVALTDQVSVDVLEDLKSVADTITVSLTDEVSVFQGTADKSVADTITVVLADQVAVDTLEQAKSVSDTITVSVTETPFVTIDIRIVTGITVGLTDAVTVLDTLVPKSVSDTITTTLTDQVSIFEMEDFFTVIDGIAVALDEQVSVSVTLSVADTIPVSVSEVASVFVLAQEITVLDTISVGLTDQVTVDTGLAFKSVTDDITTGLADDVTITVTLNRLDIMFVGLEEALDIEATLSLADTISVGLADTVSVEVTFVPGQPMIRRFSQVHDIWPINVGREGGWIA